MFHFYIDSVLLPIAPEKMTVKINNQNKTMNLINEGQVNMIKDPGLTDYEFEVLIPKVKYPFAEYVNGFINPITFFNLFSRLKKEKKPFQFIVARKTPNNKKMFGTDATVTLESYTITEDAKNGLDSKVTLKLKQYRPYGTLNVKVQQASSSTASQIVTTETKRTEKATPSTAQTHKVVSGDSLWAIAKRYYGDGNKYPEIYKANSALIDARNKGTNLSKYTIYAGQVLTIPAL